jgi:hypothetical protein
MREELAGELPDVMVPATIVELPAMPLTPNGKLDRKALPAPRAANSEDGPARSDVENIIAGIWCKLLGLSSVGTSDNFFDLGGHSLLIVQVQRQLKQTLGREVAIVDMFRHPTIAALARYLKSDADGLDDAVQKGLDRAAQRRAQLRRRQAAGSLMPV